VFADERDETSDAPAWGIVGALIVLERGIIGRDDRRVGRDDCLGVGHERREVTTFADPRAYEEKRGGTTNERSSERMEARDAEF
jgi:hypothetical protein